MNTQTASAPPQAPIVIKKYANRRLYNTATSQYVTLESLAEMVKNTVDFEVCDARSGENITHSVLTQIILEKEGKEHTLLPTSFLRQLIRFYDDSLCDIVPRYLEMSMDSFSRNQEDLRAHMTNTFGDLLQIRTFEEITKQNTAMFQNTLRLFTPHLMPPIPSATVTDTPDEIDSKADLLSLKEQVSALQKQIESLTDKSS